MSSADSKSAPLPVVTPDSEEPDHFGLTPPAKDESDGGNCSSPTAVPPSSGLPESMQPLSWPSWRKWTYIMLVGYCECLTFLVSMMLAPSVPQVLAEFRPDGGAASKSLGSFSVTVYILGFCVGPLLLGPLTDLYGRLPIYRAAATGFLLLTLACALAPSLEALIVFRFFAGCFGGAPMAIGGAVVADMFEPGPAREAPMAFYSVGTMMGPTIGPILGGVITGLHGWRWVFWVATILAGVAVAGLVLILPETHLPTLKRRYARLHGVDVSSSKGRLRRWLLLLRSGAALDVKSLLRTVGRALALPTRIAGRPPVFCILVLIAIFNGLVNMILSSLGSVYQSRYHFLPTTAGLSYLGIGIGGLAALAVTKPLKKYTTGLWIGRPGLAIRGPEAALLFLAAVPPVTTVGLLWYGWSLQESAHFIVPIIGLFFFGFGYMCTRLSSQLFLVEAVPHYTASALAAFTVASSIGGAVIPLSTFPLYDGTGYGWGNTVIALVNLSLSLIPLLMILGFRKFGGGRWQMVVHVHYDSGS